MVTLDTARLARLTGSDTSAVLPALQGMSVEQLEHEEFLRSVVTFLQEGDAQLAHLAAYKLREAAWHAIDISHALPALEAAALTDDRIPAHLAEFKNAWHRISTIANQAVATFHLKNGHELELRTMLAQPGWPGTCALASLQSATESQLEIYLPLLHTLLSTDEAVPSDPRLSKQPLAAMALARHHLRRQDWTKLGELISHPSEHARKGALRVLDDAAEDGQPIEPILPAILSIFERTDAASVAARIDAAYVLQWFVLRQNKRPKTLILDGVDLLKIPEIRAALAEVRRLGRKVRG